MVMESENARSAQKSFESLKENPNTGLSMSEYCAFRDHLYIKILFSNTCLSGVPAKMTLEEFHAAKKNPRGYIINVHEHKTDYAYGPANVFFIF